jgi:predicted CXXCH cytochrome family protein
LKRVEGFIAGPVLALVVFGGPAWGLAGTIDRTKHDFSNQISYPWNTRGYRCQICHTPHGATTVGTLLWNHTLSTATYSWSPITTLGGTTLPVNFGTWKGPSKFCLSCHDGTVSVGDLYVNGYGASCGGSDCVSGIYQIGPNLSGNHPVAVPYPFRNAANTYNGITTGTGAGTSAASYVAVPAAVRLYNENAGTVSSGAVEGKSGIECGSCHDPHDNTNTRFLRDALATICQQCHAF